MGRMSIGRRVRLRDVARTRRRIGRQRLASLRPPGARLRGDAQARARGGGRSRLSPAQTLLRGACGPGRAGAVGLIFSERLGYQFTDPTAPGVPARGRDAGAPDRPPPDPGLALPRGGRPDGERGGGRRLRLLLSAAQNDPRVEAALSRRLPVVTVDQPRGAATPFVGIDDRAAARSAAEHLRELGHERVAILSFITALEPVRNIELDLSVERLEGYKDGLGREPGTRRSCGRAGRTPPEPARRGHHRASSWSRIPPPRFSP